MDNHYDICVVGAGPAGTTIANRLSDFGYRVILIEKSSFPRPHIGLSLTSGIRQWLRVLDIEKKVEALHCKKATQSTILWSSDVPVIKKFKKEESGFHINRGRFDSLLLEECRQKKITIIQPGILQNLQQKEDSSWSLGVLNGSKTHRFSSSFIVDACGRKSVLKDKKISYLPKLMATYSYWKSNREKKHHSFIEAGEDYWYWGAPTDNDNFVLCVFSDPSELKEAPSIDRFYKNTLSKSKFATSIIDNYTIDTISVCDATSYYDTKVIGDNFIKIGDSAYTMDPISSQGVQKAIKSGIQGAIVINTILKKNNYYLAHRYYWNLIQSEVRKNKRWTTDFYNEQAIYPERVFWECRKKIKITPISDQKISLQKNDVLNLSTEGTFAMVPVLGKNEIIEKEGFLLKGNEDPFVFVESNYIIPLLKLIDGKTLEQCIRITSSIFPEQNPIKLVQWLVYQSILTKGHIKKTVKVDNLLF